MAAKNRSNKEPRLSDAFEELEDIVREFEEGDVDLENSIEKFKKGLKLSKFLKKRLKEIENEIIEIKDDYEEVDIQDDHEEIEVNQADPDDSQGEIPF